MTTPATPDISSAPPAAWSRTGPNLVQAGPILQTADVSALAAALAKFQAEVTGAGKAGQATDLRKTKDGRFYETTRSYTRLEDAWAAARGPLTKHGLSVSQMPTTSPGGVTVVTRVMHESGQWFQSELTLGIDESAKMNHTQRYGSAITYAQRYAFLAALGLPPVDDDAQGAGESKPAQGSTARSTRSKKPKAAPAGVVADLRKELETATTEEEYLKAAASVAARQDLSAAQLADLRGVAKKVATEGGWLKKKPTTGDAAGAMPDWPPPDAPPPSVDDLPPAGDA